MATPGRYADYPLPDAWLPVLAELVPRRTLPPARPLPSLGHLIDALLLPLDDRQRHVLWSRLGAEETLQAVGDLLGVTRERVRQIERQARLRLLRDASLRPVLGGVRAAFDRAGVLLLDMKGASSHLAPQATPDQLWRFVCAVWEHSQPRSFQTAQISPGLWLYSASGLPSAASLAAVLGGPDQPARFLSAATFGDLLDLGEDELLTLWPACPRLHCTEGGLFGSAAWTLPQWVEAVAGQLAAAGFREWHFSEMARALEVVAPEQFPGLLGRNVAAVLSRPGVTAFEYAGRKGCWRLLAHGDGHADNRAAIRAVLDSTDLPLHTRELERRLQAQGRHAAHQTIYALLEREAGFCALGDGVFGVAGRAYPERYAEEDWLLNLLERNAAQELPADQVHWAASAAGLDPARLEAVGRFSARVRYRKHRRGEARYMTAARADQRQFEGWFEHRHERVLPPDPAVLLHGLRTAYVSRDSATLVGVQAYLHLRGLHAPEEAHPWLTWALGYGEAGQRAPEATVPD